jgi:4-hydroxyproline epimerase
VDSPLDWYAALKPFFNANFHVILRNLSEVVAMHVRVLDSHTGGEPTRTIVSGTPLNADFLQPQTSNSVLFKAEAKHASIPSVADRLDTMRMQYDYLRTGLLNEPRGSEVMVGAILIPPQDPKNTAGLIFFNNVGYLGMCGHGTIGVVETLRFLGKLEPGDHTFETCVGNVTATLHPDRSVSLQNVPSYRISQKVPIELPCGTKFLCDVAYGGNTFALVDISSTDLMSCPAIKLIEISTQIMEAIRHTHPEVDHVELFGEPINKKHHSRSFVLCPGGQYDRSPCGTGTSAKLACLAADGKLPPDTVWYQESFIGSVFEGRYSWIDKNKGIVAPQISARAFVNADVELIVDPEDPFAWGIPTS